MYFQVTRSQYEECYIDVGRPLAAALIVNCSNPRQRRRFTLLFEPFQSIPNAPEYVPGGLYYYISEYLHSDDHVLPALAEWQYVWQVANLWLVNDLKIWLFEIVITINNNWSTLDLWTTSVARIEDYYNGYITIQLSEQPPWSCRYCSIFFIGSSIFLNLTS